MKRINVLPHNTSSYSERRYSNFSFLKTSENVLLMVLQNVQFIDINMQSGVISTYITMTIVNC